MSRDAQHPGAAVFWRAAIRVRVPSLPDDRWHGAQRFHVIDNRWAAVQSHHGWEGRFDARVPTLAFQRFHQRGLFAAFVCARPGMGQQVEIKARPENVLPQVPARISFGKCRVHDIQHVPVFAANINEAVMRMNGSSRDHHALDELVRVHLHQRPILAGARLGFIRVANHILRFRRILWHERPLHPRRESRSAAPAQIRLFHFLDDALGSHLLERFFQRLIAALYQVNVDFVRVLHAPPPADQRSFVRMTLVERAGNDRFRRRASAGIQFRNDAVEFDGRKFFVEIVVDLHRRRARASADAFHFFEGENPVVRRFLVPDLQALLSAVEQVVTAL